MIRLLIVWVFIHTPISATMAQLVYTTSGSQLTQNFDTLASTGTGISWTNNTTLTGWNLFRQPNPGSALTTYNASTGNSGAVSSFFSFGVAGVNSVTERALGGIVAGSDMAVYFGSPPPGDLAGWMAVAIQNSTGGSLTSFTVRYDGEQWRVANVVTQTMVVEYGFGATFTAVTNWNTAGASFDFTSPTLNAVSSALDGNQGSNRVANLGGTISSLNWVNGDILWIRYRETNDAGSDHGLAIDNFSFSAVSVPEPVAIVSISIAMLAGVYVVGRRFCKVVNNSDTDVVNA